LQPAPPSQPLVMTVDLGERCRVTIPADFDMDAAARLLNGLAVMVQAGLGRDPQGGEIFCFRGRKADMVKLIWFDGVGMSLYAKRLEAGTFVWPSSATGEAVAVSAAQLGYLLDGIDWRNPRLGLRGQKRWADRSEVAVFVGFCGPAW
jgi:transposase